MGIDWKVRDSMDTWLRSKLRDVLKKNLNSTQSPSEIKEALWTDKFYFDGIQTTKTDGSEFNGDIIMHYSDLPQDHFISVSFDTKTYGNKEKMISLKANMGPYSCKISKDDYETSSITITLDGILAVLKKFPKWIPSIETKESYFKKKQAESMANKEKREKLQDIRINSARSWVKIICNDLTVPYYLYESKLRLYLYLYFPDDKTEIEFQIPVSKFEKVLPELPAVIQQYLDLHKKQQVKVLISNEHTYYKRPWIFNQKKP